MDHSSDPFIGKSSVQVSVGIKVRVSVGIGVQVSLGIGYRSVYAGSTYGHVPRAPRLVGAPHLKDIPQNKLRRKRKQKTKKRGQKKKKRERKQRNKKKTKEEKEIKFHT